MNLRSGFIVFIMLSTALVFLVRGGCRRCHLQPSSHHSGTGHQGRRCWDRFHSLHLPLTTSNPLVSCSRLKRTSSVVCIFFCEGVDMVPKHLLIAMPMHAAFLLLKLRLWVRCWETPTGCSFYGLCTCDGWGGSRGFF